MSSKAAPSRSLNLVQFGQQITQTGTANITDQANACRCGTCCESDMCLSENGMWDDCVGPVAPPKERSTESGFPKADKKPSSLVKFLGKNCQCGACCDAGMCLQGIDWEDCI